LRLVLDQHPGIVFNAHYAVDGGTVFKNACALGCEGMEAARVAVCVWSFGPLGQGQKPESASGEARG
jgi:hypothetical protein